MRLVVALIAVVAVQGCAHDPQTALERCRDTPGCVNSMGASGYGPSHSRAIESGQQDTPRK
jgi:hypothetical protein